MPKYALDTNVYIDSFRSADAADELRGFLRTHLPVTYLSAVVMLELRTGVRTKEAVQTLENDVFAPFERRSRSFTPSAKAFKETGRILAFLTEREGLDLVAVKTSFVNDVLLAASCCESGVILITRDKDYSRIKKCVKGFTYVAPWP